MTEKLSSGWESNHSPLTLFFLIYRRDPNQPLHQLLGPMQCCLNIPDSGHLNLEMHQMALAIAKKTLEENRFRNTQKTTDHPVPDFQVRDRVTLKSKQPGKWDLKWSARYSIVCIGHDGHYLHIKNEAMGKTWSCNVQGCCVWTTSQAVECGYSIC